MHHNRYMCANVHYFRLNFLLQRLSYLIRSTFFLNVFLFFLLLLVFFSILNFFPIKFSLNRQSHDCSHYLIRELISFPALYSQTLFLHIPLFLPPEVTPAINLPAPTSQKTLPILPILHEAAAEFILALCCTVYCSVSALRAEIRLW